MFLPLRWVFGNLDPEAMIIGVELLSSVFSKLIGCLEYVEMREAQTEMFDSICRGRGVDSGVLLKNGL